MAKSTLDELLKQQADLQKKIEEAKQQEAEELKAESVKAFELFKQAVDKRAFATGEDTIEIIKELAGIREKGAKGKRGRRSAASVAEEKEKLEKASKELEPKVLAFLNKHPASKIDQIKKALNITDGFKQAALTDLVKTSDKVDKKGAGRGTTYSVKA